MVLKTIYKMKAEAITNRKEMVELHEYEVAKLFSYNPENLMEDEFILNTIDRVYNRIKTSESDSLIVEKVKQLEAELGGVTK